MTLMCLKESLSLCAAKSIILCSLECNATDHFAHPLSLSRSAGAVVLSPVHKLARVTLPFWRREKPLICPDSRHRTVLHMQNIIQRKQFCIVKNIREEKERKATIFSAVYFEIELYFLNCLSHFLRKFNSQHAKVKKLSFKDQNYTSKHF